MPTKKVKAKSASKTKAKAKRASKDISVQKITPFLWFDGNAEEAIELYTSLFKKSKIVSKHYMGDQLFTATILLHGQEFMVINGGPQYKFTEAVSLFVKCETQEEVDHLYDTLSEGGVQQQCGWLKDKFGLSWQIIPNILGKLLYDKDPAKSQRTMQAMLKMKKLDIQKLKAAHAGN